MRTGLHSPALLHPSTPIASQHSSNAPRVLNRAQTHPRHRSPSAPPPASSGSPRTGQTRGRPCTRATPGASSCSHGACARDVPLPRTLLRLHHRRPNFFSAISADELVCGHLPLERLQGWVFLELLSLYHAPPHCSPGKPCLAEHHRQDATAEKASEGPGCNLFFSLEGVFASFPVFGSEILKCVTNHRKIVKMQTQLIWNPCNKIYKFCNIHFCRNST